MINGDISFRGINREQNSGCELCFIGKGGLSGWQRASRIIFLFIKCS